MERVSDSFVTDDIRDCEDDIIWRLRLGLGWLYVYLLIEFQSTVDNTMAIRIMTYIGLLYQDLIKTKKVLSGEKLPPVLPIVLYNGAPRWNAPVEVSELIAHVASPSPEKMKEIVIALMVRLKLGSPVLFRQVRPGHHGKPFVLYKFRTMSDNRDENGNLLPDAARLTSLGRFLRITSVDELPALFNVLKGDMSIVGPRPLLMQYLDRYTPEQARRHEVKPGITGWAQVNGRNAISWEEKFRLDVWYVDNWSLVLDLRIILMTVLKVVQREG